jgi:hypothetical protein
MTTYIIQYRNSPNDSWINYVDIHNFNVEFVTKSGAEMVAQDLFINNDESYCRHAQVINSHGKVVFTGF